jgi:hypothetical protein
MRKFYIILLLVCSSIFTLAWINRTEEHHIHSNKNCCEIILEQVDGGVKVIYDSTNDAEDDWIFVEVEYYEEGEDPDVILFDLVDEVINMYQEDCYHNHYAGDVAKQDSAEIRAMNLPLKDCYTWQEIEIIVFGEIQE